jgi:hypothetical protein
MDKIMGGIGRGQHNNHRATYQVVELYDPPEPSLPRYVAAQRIGESAWRVVWQNRDKLSGKLAGWFRELASQGREPMERILLGRAVGLPLRTAFALANFRIAEICRMATGSSEQMADFLCVEPICRGGRGHRRPVMVVGPNGEQTEYPSISAMARAEHISRATATRRVRRGLSRRNKRITI